MAYKNKKKNKVHQAEAKHLKEQLLEHKIAIATKKHIVLLPVELLDEVLAAIEGYAEDASFERGNCKPAEMLIKEGAMPDTYYKLLALKNETKEAVK
jgi:hypothetical protein